MRVTFRDGGYFTPERGHSRFFALAQKRGFVRILHATARVLFFVSMVGFHLLKGRSGGDVARWLSRTYCDLFAVDRIAIGIAVVRLFSLLMICVLALSHGTAGLAVPHEHGLELHGSDHQAGVPDATDAQDSDSSALGRDKSGFPVEGELSHNHVSADAPFRSVTIEANRLTKVAHPRPLPARQLDSANPSPLLEPPLI